MATGKKGTKSATGPAYNKERPRIQKITGQGTSHKSRNRSKNKKRIHGKRGYRGQGR